MQSPQVSAQPLQHQFEGRHTNTVSSVMNKPWHYKVHYHNDGTGRDTYIGVNSGGFYAPYSPHPAPPTGGFNVRKSYAPPSPVMHPLGVHYYSDGSGRDSYVIRTEGGLARDAKFTD